jgi:hypothetical protein
MNYHDARNVILRSGWTPAQNMPPYNEIGAGAHYFRDLGSRLIDYSQKVMMAAMVMTERTVWAWR